MLVTTAGMIGGRNFIWLLEILRAVKFCAYTRSRVNFACYLGAVLEKNSFVENRLEDTQVDTRSRFFLAKNRDAPVCAAGSGVYRCKAGHRYATVKKLSSQ